MRHLEPQWWTLVPGHLVIEIINVTGPSKIFFRHVIVTLVGEEPKFRKVKAFCWIGEVIWLPCAWKFTDCWVLTVEEYSLKLMLFPNGQSVGKGCLTISEHTVSLRYSHAATRQPDPAYILLFRAMLNILPVCAWVWLLSHWTLLLKDPVQCLFPYLGCSSCCRCITYRCTNRGVQCNVIDIWHSNLRKSLVALKFVSSACIIILSVLFSISASELVSLKVKFSVGCANWTLGHDLFWSEVIRRVSWLLRSWLHGVTPANE